jgi:hypothetical protein
MGFYGKIIALFANGDQFFHAGNGQIANVAVGIAEETVQIEFFSKQAGVTATRCTNQVIGQVEVKRCAGFLQARTDNDQLSLVPQEKLYGFFMSDSIADAIRRAF